MNITITKDDLSTALRRVQGACSGRSVIPALSGVLLRTKGETLEAVASNGDMQISHSVPCGVLGAGEVLLPFKSFNQFVSLIGPQDVDLNVDDKLRRCSWVCGDSRGSLKSITDAFVEFPKQKRVGFEISQADLKAALKRTLPSVSTDYGRPSLCGVLISLQNNKLEFVASDGRQFAMVKHAMFSDDNLSIIVPTIIAHSAERLLDFVDDKVKVLASPNSIEFTIGDTVVTGKISCENYPQGWRDYIAKASEHRISLNREEFLGAIKYTGWIADPGKFPSIFMRFATNAITIDAASLDSESVRRLAVRYDGPAITIRMAPDRIASILSSLSDDEIALEFADHLSPVIIKTEDFLAFVAPLHKSE